MHDSEILFYYTTDDDTSDEEATSFSLSLGVKEGDDAHTISIKPTILHAGDLAYLAFIMGKANFSSSWCNWCKCDKESWQTQCAVSPDMLWDVESIIHQAASNESNGYTETPKMYSLPTLTIGWFQAMTISTCGNLVVMALKIAFTVFACSGVIDL